VTDYLLFFAIVFAINPLPGTGCRTNGRERD
jgi:hypothetical protein